MKSEIFDIKYVEDDMDADDFAANGLYVNKGDFVFYNLIREGRKYRTVKQRFSRAELDARLKTILDNMQS